MNNLMMGSNDLNKKILADVRRFLKYLPSQNDPALIILKGHLLIEEILRALIDQRVENPRALEKARLNFNQCLCMTKAFHNERYLDWIWNAVKELNGLRNLLAHKLEPQGFYDKIDKFIKYVERRHKIQFPEKLVNKFGKLRIAIMSIYINLSIFTHFKPPTPLAEALRKYSQMKAK